MNTNSLVRYKGQHPAALSWGLLPSNCGDGDLFLGKKPVKTSKEGPNSAGKLVRRENQLTDCWLAQQEMNSSVLARTAAPGRIDMKWDENYEQKEVSEYTSSIIKGTKIFHATFISSRNGKEG